MKKYNNLVPRGIGKNQMINKIISHYRIIEELGRGGMPSIMKKFNNLAL